MPSSLKRRLQKGTGGVVFLQASQFFVRFSQIPVLLAFWGSDLLGEWLILTTIQQYFTLSEVGVSQAAVREMVLAMAKKDPIAARRHFQSAWLVGLIMSALMVLLVFLIANVFPLQRWFSIKLIPENEARQILQVLALYVVAVMQTNLLHGGFVAEGRYGLGLSCRGCLHLADNVSVFAVAALGGTPFAAALALLVSRLAGWLILRVILFKVSPWLRYGVAEASWLGVKKLLRPSFGYLLVPASEALNIQGMRILVGAVYGPAAVVLFSALRTLAQLARMLLAAISQLGQNEIGRAFGNGNMDLVRRLHRRAFRLTLWAGASIAVFLLFSGERLFAVWVGDKLTMNIDLFAFFVASAALNALWTTSFMVQVGLNKPNRIAVRLFIANAIALVVAWLFSQYGGIEGVGLAVLLVDAAMLPMVIYQSLRLSGDTAGEFVRSLKGIPVDDIRKFFSR